MPEALLSVEPLAEYLGVPEERSIGGITREQARRRYQWAGTFGTDLRSGPLARRKDGPRQRS